eukprot:gene27335-34038_t
MVFASVSPDIENKSPMIPKNFHISDINCLQGFLGGVNYAILVAFLCQLYTKACTFTVIQKFFNVLSMWRWPNPILISAFEDLKLKDAGGRFLPVWNPRANYKDSLHIMPIITPAYPAMNSAYNVSTPQFRCIQDEIMRGNNMFQSHSLSSGAVFAWGRLLEPCTAEFFSRFPRYIQVTISATTMLDHRNWFGWVESRLRMLIVSLEQPPVVYSHPMANCIHRQPVEVVQDNLNNLIVASSSGDESVAGDVFSSPSATRTDSEIDLENFTLASHKKPPAPPQDGVQTSAEEPLAGLNAQGESVLSTPVKATSVSPPPAAPETWNTSFFIGLSFGQNVNYEDVTPAILDFSQRVNVWAAKKPNMDLQISSFDHQHIPSFIFDVPAEPSNVKSCTKAVKKNSAHPAALNILSVVGSGKINRVPRGESIGNAEDETDAYLHSRLLPVTGQVAGESIRSSSFHQLEVNPEHIARRMSVDMGAAGGAGSRSGSMGSRKMSVDESVFGQGSVSGACPTSKVLFAPDGDNKQITPQQSANYFQALHQSQQGSGFPQQIMQPMFQQQQQRPLYPPPQQYMPPFIRGSASAPSLGSLPLPPGVPPPPGMLAVNPAAMFANGGIPYTNGMAPFAIPPQQSGFPPLLPGVVPVYHAYGGQQSAEQFLQQHQQMSTLSEDNKRVLSPDQNQAAQQGFYSSPPSAVNGMPYFPNAVPIGGQMGQVVLGGVDPLLIYSSPPKRLRKADTSPHQQEQEQEGEEQQVQVQQSANGVHLEGMNSHSTHHHNTNHHQHQNHHQGNLNHQNHTHHDAHHATRGNSGDKQI